MLDRNRHGDGVLISVSNKFTSVACPQNRAGIELLWILYIFGVFYHPPESPESNLLELRSSLITIPKTFSVFFFDDFNLTKT